MRYCPSCHSIYTAQVDHCGIDGHRLEEAETDPLVGGIIDRYRILERLGLGAMGCVYRVAHTFLDHVYAMKVLFGDLGANRRVVERFRREAQAVSKIRHPNVVAVTDFGTTPNGLTFMVMEYLSGETLAQVIQREAPLAPSRAASITRQIAAGMGEAHLQNYVHRDIKPSNVMLRREGGLDFVKVLDFGIVGLAEHAAQARITSTGQFVGTPLYMAPEQAREPGRVHPTSDLYALGVILYEMLAGQPPFDADGVVDLLIKHTIEPVPPLPASGGLELLVDWLLAKKPEDRPQSAAEVIAEIDRLNLGPDDDARLLHQPSRTDSITLELRLEDLRLNAPLAEMPPYDDDITEEGRVEALAAEEPEPEVAVPLTSLLPEGEVPIELDDLVTLDEALPPSLTAAPEPLAGPASASEPSRPPAEVRPITPSRGLDRASAPPSRLPPGWSPSNSHPAIDLPGAVEDPTLGYEFLRGRLDHLYDLLEQRAPRLRADLRATAENRLSELRAAVRPGLEPRRYDDLAAKLSEFEADLEAPRAYSSAG